MKPHSLDLTPITDSIRGTITTRRGQGADNLTRPSSDAGGFGKRSHAYITITDSLVLLSPSWWMGTHKAEAAAAAEVSGAANVAALGASGWRLMRTKFTHR